MAYGDAQRQANKRYREKNKERVKERLTAWRQANPDKMEASRKRFHEKNPDYKRTYARKWAGTAKGRFHKLRYDAKKKDRVVEISLEEFADLLTKPCVYCGELRDSPYGYGVDRIDSSGSYTLDNIVPCCGVCNQMKSDMDLEDFYAHIAKILASRDAVQLALFQRPRAA